MKFARATVVAVLILLMAVTPLSALISPGHFEFAYASRDALSGHRLTVELEDRTGLVRGFGPAFQLPGMFDGVSNQGDDESVLLVSWGHGCGAYLTQFTFDRAPDGYIVRERTLESGCPYMILIGHAVAIRLWMPIDASTVSVSFD